MKLEKQVCTLEQSKKFKNLIGEIYGLFVYIENKALPADNKISLSKHTESFRYTGKIQDHAWVKYYPAFTVAELGAMIGRGTKGAELHWQWLLNCVNSGLSGTVAYNAVALASHIITQIENGTLSAEACNERLVA